MYTKDKTILELVARYAPEGFRKNEVKVEGTEEVTLTGTEWGGGHKNEYVLVHLLTGQSAGATTSPQRLVPGVALICYAYAGLAKYVTVYVHPSNLAPLLTKQPELSPAELACLHATRSLKNTYGGEKELRFQHCQRQGSIKTWDEWTVVRDELIRKGFLTKLGALTTAGKNVAENLR